MIACFCSDDFILPHFFFVFCHSCIASIWLTCHGQECELEISKPYHRKSTKITFPRQQLLRTQQVKTDRHGHFLREDSSQSDYHMETYTTKDENGNIIERKRSVPINSNIHSTGPDKNGDYDSYSIVLEDPASEQYKEKDESQKTTLLTDLKPIYPFGTKNEYGQFVFIFRQFGVAQSKRRVRTMVQKIESYVNQRRSKIVVQEETDLSWKGIVGLVIGLFGILVTILFGQLLEEEEEIRLQTVRRQKQMQRQRKQLSSSSALRSGLRPGMGGPGVRRQAPMGGSSSASSSRIGLPTGQASSSTPRYSITTPTQRKVSASKSH